MATISGLLGAASTVGGLASNLLNQGKVKGAGGEHKDVSTRVRGNINDFGVQKDNLGFIEIASPQLLRERYQVGAQIAGITSRAEGFNVPGTMIQTSETRRYGVGPLSRLPVGSVNVNTFTVTMIADKDGAYYKTFIAWMDTIVHFNGRRKAAMGERKWSTDFYEVSYFKNDTGMYNYASDIRLIELDDRFDTIIETTLIGAYPISIQDKQINWGNSGLMKFNVEFAFISADTNIEKIEQNPQTVTPRRDIIGTILKGVSVVRALSSLRKTGGIAKVGGLVATGAAALSVVGGIRR